jgi:hypothetical protein
MHRGRVSRTVKKAGLISLSKEFIVEFLLLSIPSGSTAGS